MEAVAAVLVATTVSAVFAREAVVTDAAAMAVTRACQCVAINVTQSYANTDTHK